MDEGVETQSIEDRLINFVSVYIYTELGCDPYEGKYSMTINSFIGSLDISSNGGVDDISLIKDCIGNNLYDISLPSEGATQVVLRESGEWEGFNWNKFYEIERIV
tara:strand:- start:8328 stop:8642 length:315 start_codon:yes stop_codon:yes gene_type:complete